MNDVCLGYVQTEEPIGLSYEKTYVCRNEY